MIRTSLIALAMIALLGGKAGAADAEGNFWIFSFQGDSCKSWSAEHQKEGFGKELLQVWVLGYLTAYNNVGYDGYNVAEGTSLGGIYALIDDYCRGRPLDNLLDATHEMILELERRQETR